MAFEVTVVELEWWLAEAWAPGVDAVPPPGLVRCRVALDELAALERVSPARLLEGGYTSSVAGFSSMSRSEPR
jgi:hypothetical protein